MFLKKFSEGILDMCHGLQILIIPGVGGLGESVKKGKLATKIFFN